jgi:hypothetical protein
MWWLLAIVWIVCGVIEYGVSFAYFQRRWPRIAERDYWDDLMQSVCWALFGPFSLLATFWSGTWGYGFKWR